ncbi:MAG TPA: glycosyltransferase [Burkholderiaceae bacterium]|nr:glycosyltransferase [Burkholderiaceae bacterium]
MKPPAISVIIPAYNASATLGRAIGSVLEQTRPAHEIIVVDDGSRDGTAEVARHYGPRVQIVQQANAGPSAARNRGVEAATGDWIAFLDADDWYYPDRLERHSRMIEADRALDFLVGNFDYRDSSGTRMHSSMSVTRLGRELLAMYGSNGHAVIEGEDLGRYISEQFSDTRMLTLPKRTFSELGGFPLELRICEDVVFLLRLCARSRRGGVTCTPGAVYLVHEHGLIRSDRLRAQTESVRALRLQAEQMRRAPAPVRDAWRHLVKDAYLDLAYHLAKRGQRGAAMGSLARSFAFQPAAGDLWRMLSIVRG